ncbi:MAG: crotonase/enoyl-CoA hydratase family protein [Deltaproteobacteria bacterium]|nr:crotonase/enoyl-CoA hydratase family protein [Deltaproteobacteria bacterium]
MATTYEVFRTEKKDRVFWVVMNNPTKRNAMGAPFWKELPEVFAEAGADDHTRAVVLAAEGKSFCAGLDFMALGSELPMLISGEPGGRPKQQFVEVIRRFQRIGAEPESCRKPVIAAIHGHCIGGGLDLAAACDIRLASRDALLSLREVAMAMVADLGSLQRLVTIVGEGVVRELAFTAADVTAERALALGLVSSLHDDRDALWQAAQAMGETIADNSPIAVETTKEVLNWGRGKTVEEGLEYAAVRQAHMVPNPDLMEAMAAFASRRKADF